MAASQQYSLRWNNYLRHITYAFDNLRSEDDFVDVTLCCDGRKIKAHKVLLSACSGYFKEIFKENPCPHPVIIFKFIKYEDLQAIIEFMYQGEVNVQQEALQSFLQTAELLAVQGLTSEEKDKPKTARTPVEQRIIEEQLVKALPASVRTITSEGNSQTQTQTIELQTSIVQNSARKRKLTYTDDDDGVYTETVEFVKEEEPTIVKTGEVQFIPASIKMDIPDYIQVPEGNQLTDAHAQQTQQSSQDTTTQTTGQFTSEYTILTDQTNYESEIDDKFSGNEGTESGEITSVEMGRIFTTANPGENNAEDKANMSTQGTLGPGEFLQCCICNRHLQSAAALKRHMESKHGSSFGKHDCTKCKKSFKTKWSLSTHNSRFHRLDRLQKETIDLTFNF